MSLFQKTLHKISVINFIPLAKYSLTSSTNTFYFKSNFTQDEQSKILNILNDSDPDQLSRFHVSQNRIKNINSWKSKKGPFSCLNEVLEVEGLGEKLLLKLCEDIVNDKTNINDSPELVKINGKSKRNKNLVAPVINGNILNNLTSGVGIHLSPTGISWAKLKKEGNTLVNWNFEDFSLLPKKMLPHDTFTQSINIVKKIPPSDIYIFETNPSLGPQSQSSQSSSYTQQLELSAMLLALINTSINHNVTSKNSTTDSPPKCVENIVFYLKSRIPARLFNTLIGQEKVSAAAIIKQLLEREENENVSCLPCTPITVESHLKTGFNSQSPANKELLGQALMLIISFMDLCVYKNPVSLSAISKNKNQK